jgi:hypothetical protein
MEWPFDDPPNLATITTRGVIDGAEWIASVSHDEDDGGWQFLGPRGARMDEAIVVALRRVWERDESIGELSDLPEGWTAWRDGPDEPWQRGLSDDN